MAPIDPIIGLNEEFAKDSFPSKVIVGVGAYRDDAGKPYVLPCVREAERRMTAANLDMEYSGIVRSTAVLRRHFFSVLTLFLGTERMAMLGWRSKVHAARSGVRVREGVRGPERGARPGRAEPLGDGRFVRFR
jgi:aspartate aminotransferase